MMQISRKIMPPAGWAFQHVSPVLSPEDLITGRLLVLLANQKKGGKGVCGEREGVSAGEDVPPEVQRRWNPAVTIPKGATISWVGLIKDDWEPWLPIVNTS